MRPPPALASYHSLPCSISNCTLSFARLSPTHTLTLSQQLHKTTSLIDSITLQWEASTARDVLLPRRTKLRFPSRSDCREAVSEVKPKWKGPATAHILQTDHFRHTSHLRGFFKANHTKYKKNHC